MLPKTCFICNTTSENCQINLAQIKSQHSHYPLLIFMRKFLRKSILNRNITNKSNCICEGCLIRVNEYDDLCVKAKRIEDELHKSLIKSDKSWKAFNQQETIDCLSQQTPSQSDDSRNEEEDDTNADNIEHAEFVDNQESVVEQSQPNPLPQTQMIVNTTPSNLKSYFKCETCLQICADEKSLVEHCKKHKDVSPWQCVECDMIFTQKTSLLKHVMCHNSNTRYQCDICGKAFIHCTTFSAHMAAHENIPKQKCDICSKSFRHLKSHLLTHTGEKPFPCMICGKKFNRRDNRAIHQKLHEDKGAVNIYKCTFCQSSFARKAKLNDHMQKKHGTMMPHTSIGNELNDTTIKARSLGDSI